MKIDTSRPYPPSGLTSETWLDQPVKWFNICDLVLTQHGVYFEPLFHPEPPVGGDEYAHVVVHDGVQYLEDGHTRMMRALLKQSPMLLARWIEVP